LVRYHGKVHVGPETARACKRAAELAKEIPDATVCAVAAYSTEYGVHMGAEPMQEALKLFGIEPERIWAPRNRREFTTAGEAQMLLCCILQQPGPVTVFVACRWWHLPRAARLLEQALPDESRGRTKIVAAPVWSWQFWWGIPYEACAWIKHRRRLFPSHRTKFQRA